MDKIVRYCPLAIIGGRETPCMGEKCMWAMQRKVLDDSGKEILIWTCGALMSSIAHGDIGAIKNYDVMFVN